MVVRWVWIWFVEWQSAMQGLYNVFLGTCFWLLRSFERKIEYIPLYTHPPLKKHTQTTVFLSESMREVHSTTCLSARLRLIKDVTSSRGQNHLLALHRCCSWLPGAWGWKECHPQRDQVCIFCGIGAQNVEPVSLKLQAFGNKAKHWTKFLNNWLEVSHFCFWKIGAFGVTECWGPAWHPLACYGNQDLG